MRIFLMAGMLSVCLMLSSCQPKEEDDIRLHKITFPSGQTAAAEVYFQPRDVTRGMMLRPALPAGRAVLFMHQREEPRAAWMFQARAPLDIVFVNGQRRVVEIFENLPPCLEKSSQSCRTYGGGAPSRFTLNLPAGDVKRVGLRVNDQLEW